jgi:zinc D-Ala-D-Ala dipeptidase
MTNLEHSQAFDEDIYAPYGFRMSDVVIWNVVNILNSPFVEMWSVDSSIEIDLKYATTDNITWEPQYPPNMKAILRFEVAHMLREAQTHLKNKYGKQFSILLLDAGRPEDVQKKMYEWCEAHGKSGLFVPPERGSMHTFGCAVDVTILKEGILLDMGTGYDDDRDIAKPEHEQRFLTIGELTRDQYSNRILLREVMWHAWFSNISNEWWHFETPDDNDILKRRQNIRKYLPKIL